MAVDLDPASQRHEEEEEEEAQVPEEGAPAHHPVAPPDELFDISTTVDPSYIISLIRKLIPTTQSDSCHLSGGVNNSGNDHKFGMDCSQETEVFPADGKVESSLRNKSEIMPMGQEIDGHGVPAGEETWEEYGCILWDLAASRTNAELMVQNLVLEVLQANLMVPQSVRVKEICLGIIGNLACHEVLMDSIVSTSGLIQTIIDQLFLDDSQCLSEACRLLTLCLQSNECVTWAKALQPNHVIQRLVWIAENTLNPLLLEKSVGLMLVILESERGAAPILLPRLDEIGLTKLLISLLDYEISKLTSEITPERFPVLDVILRTIEALSTMDDYSQEISSNKELVQLICNLVKLPDKMEISESCVTAAVLLANILSDEPDLAAEMSQDLPLLQGLFDILPFTSNDAEARSALWSTIAQLLNQIKGSTIELYRYVSVLACKCDLIEEDLLDHQLDQLDKHESSDTRGTKSNPAITALRQIVSILNDWTSSKDIAEEKDVTEEHRANYGAVIRLLEVCDRYIK
ncbi:protein SAAL1 isoform X2 [Punica granatum]|uniref:Protein SAAL1 isoform X2 n=1 Tax=Punica granatum TaxID=22663 RepID=A0A6P8E898_PUNGR|nr:protein SAAL1 isoform X2 [Punica granatum]